MKIETLDLAVFLIYFLVVLGIALWVSRAPRGHTRNTEDYFLAGRGLPWWIIGASLVASNISTEQLVGMNGTAFVSGIAVISYSWIGACIPQLLVAKFFLPAFLKMKVYSMPQFLELRFDHRVSTGMGIFWLLVYVFVNLTSVLYLGALSLETLVGLPLVWGVVALAAVAAFYTVYGGLAPVAWTDFIQVAILILGGAMVIVFGLDAVSGGNGIIAGFIELLNRAPDKFHTVLEASHPDLPWTGVFFSGLWIAAVSYWGCNQYIIQKALAARSLREAQYGLVFASFLSLTVSFIIVFPGVIAWVLYSDVIQKPDEAYPTLIRELIPAGYTGLIIAALVAAIISSLNSMTNSAATIFTMDVYRKLFRKDASEKECVQTGRIASAVALTVASCCAPLLVNLSQVFQFIQEYTGFITPGIMAIFLAGPFWKRATSGAALAAALLTIPVSAALKFLLPNLGFLNRMGITFALLMAVIAVITFTTQPDPERKERLEMREARFDTPALFNALALLLLGTITALYLYFR
ncbi:MAG: sodium/solute symporter [Acidobacteriota bacterium]|nr:MAG: sodium/solute symporter [Acidobacteriota bacterium]